MKKIIITLILLSASCATQLSIPKPKNGESFYAESLNSGMKTIKETGWNLYKIDTLKQLNNKPLFLFHYSK